MTDKLQENRMEPRCLKTAPLSKLFEQFRQMPSYRIYIAINYELHVLSPQNVIKFLLELQPVAATVGTYK